MGISAEAATILARAYLHALAMAVVFIGAGRLVWRLQRGAAFARSRLAAIDDGPLDWGTSYFLGLSCFLLLFVPAARLLGATRGLWIVLMALAGAALVSLANRRPAIAVVRPAAGRAVAGAALVAFYSVSNVALWVSWGGTRWQAEPTLLVHFGSIHSGRYANYARFVADHDRIPFLSQNAGQSLLASTHLLVGGQAPLAALMVWLPISLAFLTLLLHALFRGRGMSPAAAAGGVLVVMFCNVAVSLVHTLVFDNGSPLAFIGYTDMVAAVGTFLVGGVWLRARLLPSSTEIADRPWVLPALFGLTWAWYAPQNIVLALASAAAATWAWNRRAAVVRRRQWPAAIAFVLAVGAGATQLGPLLPTALREETGLWTQEVEPALAVRPYVQYMIGHWSGARWNLGSQHDAVVPRVYETAYAEAVAWGRDQIYRRIVNLFEEHLWTSLRVYGFPILGLLLLGVQLERRPADEQTGRDRAWLLLSAFSFLFGYLIAFGLELGHMKWWLTRFLVPGTAMALVCLVLVWHRRFGGAPPGTRRAAWALLIVTATSGPLIELATVWARNVVKVTGEPIGPRLTLLASSRGPFIFDSIEFHPDAATRDSSGVFTVGDPGQRSGAALFSRPMWLAAGQYRVGYRIDPGNRAPDLPMATLDVTADSGSRSVGRRVVAAAHLESRPDGRWVWLDFDLAGDVRDVRLLLASTAPPAFRVTGIALEKR